MHIDLAYAWLAKHAQVGTLKAQVAELQAWGNAVAADYEKLVAEAKVKDQKLLSQQMRIKTLEKLVPEQPAQAGYTLRPMPGAAKSETEEAKPVANPVLDLDDDDIPY
jgi:hypothetical protein